MMDVLNGNDHYMNLWNAADDDTDSGGSGNGSDDDEFTISVAVSTAAATFLLFMGAMNRKHITRAYMGQGGLSMSKRGLVENADGEPDSPDSPDAFTTRNSTVEMTTNPIAIVSIETIVG